MNANDFVTLFHLSRTGDPGPVATATRCLNDEPVAGLNRNRVLDSNVDLAPRLRDPEVTPKLPIRAPSMPYGVKLRPSDKNRAGHGHPELDVVNDAVAAAKLALASAALTEAESAKHDWVSPL